MAFTRAGSSLLTSRQAGSSPGAVEATERETAPSMMDQVRRRSWPDGRTGAPSSLSQHERQIEHAHGARHRHDGDQACPRRALAIVPVHLTVSRVQSRKSFMPSICFRRVVNSFGLCCSAHMGRVLTGPSDVVRLCGRAAGGSSWALARLAPLFRLPTRRVGSAPAEPHRLRQPQGTGGRGCVAGRQQPQLLRPAARPAG
jgi:hypothetical protein